MRINPLTNDEIDKQLRELQRMHASYKGGFGGPTKHILTKEDASRAGLAAKAAGVGVHGLTTEEIKANAVLGGRAGGPVQGAVNARIGWMQHISLIRLQKPHNKCPYCNRRREENDKPIANS
jgi:hypothetical protein